jgi:ubiquinone/menaquinone biosynthesis C-methylase UbiE
MHRKERKTIVTLKSTPSHKTYSSWQPVADWYDSWMGANGSYHHRQLAIPAVLDLLALQPGESVLDIGAGQGVLAPHVSAAGAHYTGIDASIRMLQLARKHHGKEGRFLQSDARHLQDTPGLRPGTFDAAVFLLSIQDMDPLPSVLESVAWTLRGGGRIVLLMTHPCFRVPRQSGWGWQPDQQLQYRRVNRYLTPLTVPMKTHPRERGATISFHRPLQQYINSLAACSFFIDQMKEITASKLHEKQTAANEQAKAERRANQEIPLFLGLRARKALSFEMKT